MYDNLINNSKEWVFYNLSLQALSIFQLVNKNVFGKYRFLTFYDHFIAKDVFQDNGFVFINFYEFLAIL